MLPTLARGWPAACACCLHGGRAKAGCAGWPSRLPASPCTARRYVVPLLWLPVAAAFMWRGVLGGLPPLMLPITLAIGVLVWQLIEYSIHR